MRQAGEQVPLVIIADTWVPGYLKRLPCIPRLLFGWSNGFHGLRHHFELIRSGKARVAEILASDGLRLVRKSRDLATALIRGATLEPQDWTARVVLPSLEEARDRYRACASVGKLVLFKSEPRLHRTRE